jgi:hypothetical protein
MRTPAIQEMMESQDNVEVTDFGSPDVKTWCRTGDHDPFESSRRCTSKLHERFASRKLKSIRTTGSSNDGRTAILQLKRSHAG